MSLLVLLLFVYSVLCFCVLAAVTKLRPLNAHTVYWESFAGMKFREFREIDSVCETLICEC